MQEMGRGVVASNLPSPAGIDRGGRRLSNLQLTGDDGTEMCDHAVGGFLSVLDAQAATLRVDAAGVADLPAGLGVEGCSFEKQLDVLAFDGAIRGLPLLAYVDARRPRPELLI